VAGTGGEWRRLVVDAKAKNWVAEVNEWGGRHMLYAEAKLWGAEAIGGR